MSTPRKPYPSDVTDGEWAFVAPYLTLMDEEAPQRRHDLREVFNALRWLVRTGAPWRFLPNDLPPWAAVYQRTQRWLAAECFGAMADDLAGPRARSGGARSATDGGAWGRTHGTLQATPESGHRAGYDGHERRKGSKPHAAVDALGHLLVARSTPANEQGRAQVAALAAEAQRVTGDAVEVAFVDRGYTGEDPAEAAEAHGIGLVVVRLPAAKRGFVLPPRRWVVARSFAWATRCRRLAKDDERLPHTVVGLHFVAVACLMLHRALPLLAASP